jgi:hypothetical protein
MNRRAHYIRLYKRLGLSESATLDDLKLSYRRLAGKYHPDKSAQLKSTPISDDYFIEIQSSYRELRRYHDQHGDMPLKNFNQHSYKSNSNLNRDTTTTSSPYKIHRIAFALILTLFLIFILLPNTNNTHVQARKASTQNSDKNESINHLPTEHAAKLQHSHEGLDQPELELGMTMGETFEILGVPDDTINDIWYYNSSEIYFRDGLVAGWKNAPESPIQTDHKLPNKITPLPRY